MCFVLTVHLETWRRCSSLKNLKAKKLHFWLDQFWGEAQSLEFSLHRWYTKWGQVNAMQGW